MTNHRQSGARTRAARVVLDFLAARTALRYAAPAAVLVLAACSAGSTPAAPVSPTSAAPSAAASVSPSVSPPVSPSSTGAARVSKVMIVLEENETAESVLGSGEAPYLTALASTYGTATRMNAGYPTICPSLAAYLILTSGSDHSICDDQPPHDHPLVGDSVFAQVRRSGRQWRAYAESMPADCELTNSPDGLYLVRHTPATYYLPIRKDCGRWQVPLGTTSTGALHDDLAAGTLPAYSFVTPNACNDMHGAAACPDRNVAIGDAWLARWMPSVLAGPDFRSGRLAVIVTWDEGSLTSNHIPTLVLSAHTRQVSADPAWTHCSTLRTTEEILDLPLLRCARTAHSMRSAFGL